MIPDVEAAIRQRLADERDRTHWPTCYEAHWPCCVALLFREIDRLQEDLAEARRGADG